MGVVWIDVTMSSGLSGGFHPLAEVSCELPEPPPTTTKSNVSVTPVSPPALSFFVFVIASVAWQSSHSLLDCRGSFEASQ